MSHTLQIIVDYREPQKIKNRLSKFGMQVVEEQLDIADYIISSQIACERKTGTDLIASIMDNRLFEQIDRLIETYEQPILILENINTAFERTEWKKRKKHVYGALTYIFLRRQVPVVPTTTMGETAIVLNRITSWVQEEHEDPLIARKSPKKKSLRDKQNYFLQGLQNTGQKKADLLLNAFNGSPINVINAISESQVKYTKTGNPKGLEGPFSKMKGFGPGYILENKKLLKEETRPD